MLRGPGWEQSGRLLAGSLQCPDLKLPVLLVSYPQEPQTHFVSVCVTGGWGRDNIYGVGGDLHVSIVKEHESGYLDDEHVGELNGQHEHQLPDAADLQEHGAGQQAEQHTAGEILWRQTVGGCQSDGLAPAPLNPK